MQISCPICQATAGVLHELAFPPKLHLPQQTSICVCEDCDFAFSSPRDAASYLEYYSANLNDKLGADLHLSAAELHRYRGQMEVLQLLLQQPRSLRILDVGCGQAGLLRTMCEHYPHHSFFAVDPNLSPEQMASGAFSVSTHWKDLPGSFDLIILSHVIEHVVNFDEIALLSERLSPSGQMYIEVPDASRYGCHPRREFLYYLDRLHINHFSGKALRTLVRQWGLATVAAGRSSFEYKDTRPFPAQYIMASRSETPTLPELQAAPVSHVLRDYLGAERVRAGSMKSKLIASSPIVVYGFGDNFHRSVAIGGPLEGVLIAAIIDMRHSALNESAYAGRYRFMDIDSCCEEFPDAAYVVTVSWGHREVSSELRKRNISNIEII